MRLLAVLVLVAAAACRPPGWGKDPGVDATSVDGAGGVDAANPVDGAPPDAATCARVFRLEGFGSASTAWVSGDFVGWAGNPTDGALAMTLGQDTAWTVAHTFDPGTYQYRFIVDGTSWMPDPANPNTVPNGLGGVNSVITCP